MTDVELMMEGPICHWVQYMEQFCKEWEMRGPPKKIPMMCGKDLCIHALLVFPDTAVRKGRRKQVQKLQN